jgi:hypothetical protein
MSYPIFGNLSLGNVSGNIKLFVNHSGIGNLTGIGYNNNAMTFGVNQSATDTPEMIINRIGDVDILGNVYTGGNVVVNAIAPSTSTTTGALRVAGGIGIQGNLNIGGNLRSNGDISCSGNIIINNRALIGPAPTVSLTGALIINESVGSSATTNTGSLIISHNNNFGNSSILFPSKSNPSTDRAFIEYQESSNIGSGEKGTFIIGIGNDTAEDKISLYACAGAGFVGVNTLNPTSSLDVNGNINISSSNSSYISGPFVSTNTTESTSTTTGALRVGGGAGIQGNIFIGGSLITNGDISCNGNIDIRFPITTTYTALPTFTNNQVGNILANVFLTQQNISTNNIYPFNILYNIPPGIWMANYTVHIVTANNAGAGNITFGMSTVTPAFTGTTMNVFPLNLNSSYGVQRIPIVATAAAVTAASGPIILSGTAVIPFSETGTISIVGNINGFTAAGNTVARSVLTATRIA